MKACDHGPDPAGNRHAANRVRPLFRSLSGRNVERRKDLSIGERRWRVLTLTQATRDIPELSASTGRAELRKTVPLLMMVVATGHFNRVGMAVAGTDRIVKVYGVDPEKMGLVYSAFLLVYTLAMLPGGWFIDRFGPRVALMVLCFGSTVFVALTGAVGLMAEGPWCSGWDSWSCGRCSDWSMRRYIRRRPGWSSSKCRRRRGRWPMGWSRSRPAWGSRRPSTCSVPSSIASTGRWRS